MTLLLVVVAQALIALTGPAGDQIDINPAEIISLRQAAKDQDAKIRCIIRLTDGTSLGVTETCHTVLTKFNSDLLDR